MNSLRTPHAPFLITLLLGVSMAACYESQPTPAEDRAADSVTGMVDVPGGKVFFEMYHADAPGIPLLMIHGGPGMNSCGFGLLDELITDRPIIRYDQLDTGLSERPGDRSTWVLSHFVEEVEAIRKALFLDEVHVLGHSWGGTVAAEFALEGDTEGVVSIVLAGPLLSTSIWLDDAQILLAQMPEHLQHTIRSHEATGTYSHPDYIAATDSFYARFLNHIQPPRPVPECEGVGINMEMYETMWGPTEFTSTGTLLDYDRFDRLHEIQLPVLLIVGEFDEARPETMIRFADQIPDAEIAIIPGAGHAAMVDQPELYAAQLKRFLSKIEARE